MGYQADLYWQYSTMTDFCSHAGSREAVIDELADMILSGEDRPALAEPGMPRAVRRQLHALDPSLSPYELHYNFREHFRDHFDELLRGWLDAAARWSKLHRQDAPATNWSDDYYP